MRKPPRAPRPQNARSPLPPPPDTELPEHECYRRLLSCSFPALVGLEAHIVVVFRGPPDSGRREGLPTYA